MISPSCLQIRDLVENKIYWPQSIPSHVLEINIKHRQLLTQVRTKAATELHWELVSSNLHADGLYVKRLSFNY